MNVTLSFVEYDAVSSLRDMRPLSFTLVSTAKLGKVGNRRTWVIEGSPSAFESLRGDLDSAMGHFLRASVAASLTDVTNSINAAMESAALIDSSAPIAAEAVEAT